MAFKFPKVLILITLCGLAPVGGVNAQPAPDDAPVAGRSTLGVAVAETELITRGWRATKLLRADVYNDKKQKVGRVDDFIVSPDGSLSVAVVDVGGFLGMGAHRVAIPVQQFGEVSPKIILPGATKDSLKQLPEFNYSR